MSQTAALAPAKAEPRKGSRRAVIDIGSNTIRLVVYAGPRRAPTTVHNEKVTPQLGRELDATGRIADDSWAIALAGLARFAILLRELKVRDIETVATAAVRDAENGEEFLDAVRQMGFEPRLLSGEEEAVTSANGVLGAFPACDGIVVDLGGGSLEFVEIDGTVATHGLSLPLGTLRLPQLRAKGDARFAKAVAKMIRKADYSVIHDRPLYLVGGSLRAFGRIAMIRDRSPLTDTHAFEMSPARAAALAEELAGSDPARLANKEISSNRTDMLPDAAALLSVVLDELQPSRVIFSAWGLREGLLYQQLAPDMRAQDPLIAGVATFAADDGRGEALRMATMVAGWTAAIRNQGQHGRERLRLATIMLALASHRVEPNLRRDHALDWALHKRWVGITPEERALVAAAMLAQTGTTTLPKSLRQLAGKGALAEGKVWGLAIRLCRRIAGCSLGSLINSELNIVGKTLVLSLSPRLMPLYNEGTETDLANLAKALKLKYRCEPL